MRIKILFLTLLACVMSMLSCSDSKNDTEALVQYVAFQVEKDGKWGLVNLNGEVLVNPIFDNEPTEVTCDRFFVKGEDGLYQLYTAEAQPKVVGTDKYINVGVFHDGKCPVAKPGSAPMYIDTQGNVLFTMDRIGDHYVLTAGNFSEGRARIMLDNHRWCYIDETGKLVIEAKYYASSDFENGLAIVYKPLKEGQNNDKPKWSVINRDGNELFTTKVERMDPVYNEFATNGHTIVTYGDNYAIIDSLGEKKLTVECNNIGKLIGDYFVYLKDKDCGIKDIKGNDILEPNYEGLVYPGYMFYTEVDNGEEKKTYSILNMKGETIKKIDALEFRAFGSKYVNGNCLYIKPDSTTGFFANSEGEKLNSSADNFIKVSSHGDDRVMRDNDLLETAIAYLNLNKEGVQTVKINSSANDINYFTVPFSYFLPKSKADRENQILYMGKLMTKYCEVSLNYDKNLYDNNGKINTEAKLREIIVCFDMGDESNKLYDIAKKKIEEFAESIGKVDVYDVYAVEGADTAIGIYEDEGTVFIVYQRQ